MADEKREALERYMARIEAEELNFRRWMVKARVGVYYREVATITVSPDGKIKAPKDHEPTEEEAAAIAEEAKTWSMPASCTASAAATKKLISEKKWPKKAVFWFHDEDGVKMLQVRVPTQDGGKAYVPWTFWSDGKWRAMEPDSSLPFYRPREATSERIMIHEGAKSAAAAAALAEEGAHPWARELAEYEHWGMIGGALVPHRSDWAALKARKPVEVAYFCDNDYQGIDALAKVSKAYGRELVGIKPDRSWPTSWDIADPLPEGLFNATGRYIGPRLEELKVPATWATEPYWVEGSKRPRYKITSDFNQRWIHIVDPEVYICLDHPNQMYTASQFDHLIAPFSDVAQTSALFRAEQVSGGVRMTYDPAQPSGLNKTEAGGTVVNTHLAPRIDPEPGDLTIWEDYLTHLFPLEADRNEVKRWCATLIARPDTRMHYGLLLVSEMQGVGKTTLGEKILAPLVGLDNTSYPSEEAVVNSQFNEWIAHKRLAIVNELYAGRSSRAYNKLKSIITDSSVTINRKYLPEYTVPNQLNIFANSNSFKALKISQEDRRWLVPQVSEEKRPTAVWDALNDWLGFQGGLNKIRWWAEEYVSAHGPVRTGEPAPQTAAKAAVVEEGMSDMELWIASQMESLNEKYAPDSKVFFCDREMIEVMVNSILEGRRPDYLIKPLTVRKIAKAMGWFVAEEKAQASHLKVRGLPTRIICRSQEQASMGAKAISQKGQKPIDLNELLCI